MRLVRPDEYYVSVLDIAPRRLAAQGVELVLLDIDNTILPRTTSVVPPSVRAWVDELRARGMQVVLLSNSTKPRSHSCAEQLGLPLVGNAWKPRTRGFRQALDQAGVLSQHAVMIGDQSYTDILGAHLAGVRGLLVKPMVSADLKHTLALRKVEALWLRNIVPEGTTDLRIFDEPN